MTAPGGARRLRRIVSAVLLAAAAGGAAACSSWEPAYSFLPQPGVVVLRCDGTVVGRVEATVLGVREESASAPATVHVRVRVERAGEIGAAVPTGNMILLAGDGRPLPLHDVRGASPAVPPAGGAVTWVAVFAIPGPARLGDVRLDRLDLYLRAEAGVDGRMHHVPFQRAVPDEPWWDPFGREPN